VREDSFQRALWLFPLTATLHNLEEAIWLPSWSAHAGRFQFPVTASAFRFAIVVLTVLAYSLTYLAARRGGRWLDVTACFWLATLINVIFPHVLASVLVRGYSPGVVTAIALILPTDTYLLRRALREKRVTPRRLGLTAALFLPSLALSIPLLFKIGRAIF
jgi:hypothetical protein